jgi:hypothetical protein
VKFRDTGTGRLLSAVIVAILIGVHVLLVAIGAAGIVEWLAPDPPWQRFSNPDLPPWMLLLQWVLMLVAGAMFVAGYAFKWRVLPHAMLAIYAVMAGVCAVQTFTMLTNADRFTDMAIEYAEYAVILLFLYMAPPMRRRFGAAQAERD